MMHRIFLASWGTRIAWFFGVGIFLFSAGSGADLKPVKPLSPREEQATFRLPKGFRAELVACEPQVVDPVAIAFDEDGRLFVAEMRGYPNAGVGTGKISTGKVKLLEDRDGDGFYESSTVYADGLRFPTSVMPWKGGLLVTVAPDIVYFQDTTGKGKADKKRTLYTGFDLANIQQLVGALQWGLDNWVYGCAGHAGGTIRSPEKASIEPVVLRGRGIRFHPEEPGSLEPTSGGGQFGLAADDYGNWVTATNSQHLRHIVLPDHYLRRNPSLPVSQVTLDIPDHNPACKVYRISPFESWRVERTRRRRKGEGGFDPRNFPSTELVPGGFITSACSPVVYNGGLFPKEYHGNTFVCDPANNLVHRDLLEERGATFTAKRAHPDCEFLASTDNWFRPVNLTIGPDGALYVVDFYREVIETPLSLPDDIKKKLNLESRGRGRIWRIVPAGRGVRGQGSGVRGKRARPGLSKARTEELVKHLDNDNIWWRLTAQRLLVERQDKAAVKPLQKLAHEAKSGPGRAHALWTLRGLKSLDDALIERACKDPVAGVREQAIRLAEGRLASSKRLRQAVAAVADDPSPHVRFQLAFSLGESAAPEALAALAKIARRDIPDPWTQTAVLSSAGKTAPKLLHALARDTDLVRRPSALHLQLIKRLAALVAGQARDAELARTLDLLGDAKGRPAAWQAAVLEGLGQGLQNSSRPLAQLWEKPPPALKKAVVKALPFFTRAAAAAGDEKRPLAERIAAARLLGSGPYATAALALAQLLSPDHPAELQLAAVRALSLHGQTRVADQLLAGWDGYSPALRREVLEALFARQDRLMALLNAIEKKKVLAGQLEPFRVLQLRKHANPDLRKRALKLLAGQIAPDRQKVVKAYQAALRLKPDAARGKTVFKKNCSTCHRLQNVGVEVGPDLLSALRTKTPDTLLVDILDPSREVDPRYINYMINTKAGRSFTGIIAAETAASVTLRRAEKAEDIILRRDIDEIQAMGKSLMPEELEKQLSKQDVADVIAYLLAVAAGK
jgi:putative membrane-bound dehydrogenase-like protein